MAINLTLASVDYQVQNEADDDRPRPLALAAAPRLLQAMVASGLVGSVERNLALAQTAADYKALVCLFQAGGNDGENTLVRYDTAGYQQYARCGRRRPASTSRRRSSRRSSRSISRRPTGSTRRARR
jgi:hypothetical protein